MIETPDKIMPVELSRITTQSAESNAVDSQITRTRWRFVMSENSKSEKQLLSIMKYAFRNINPFVSFFFTIKGHDFPSQKK